MTEVITSSSASVNTVATTSSPSTVVVYFRAWVVMTRSAKRRRRLRGRNMVLALCVLVSWSRAAFKSLGVRGGGRFW